MNTKHNKEDFWYFPTMAQSFMREFEIALALSALESATNKFTLKWRGNKTIQKEFATRFNKLQDEYYRIKKRSCRTPMWMKSLVALGMIEISSGYIKLKLPGRLLLRDFRIYSRLTKEERFMRYRTEDQINAIKEALIQFHLPSKKIFPRAKHNGDCDLHPARIVAYLLTCGQLDERIRLEEFIYFVMKMRKDKDVHNTIEKIKEYREWCEINCQQAFVKDQKDARATYFGFANHAERMEFENTIRKSAIPLMEFCSLTNNTFYRYEELHVSGAFECSRRLADEQLNAIANALFPETACVDEVA